VNYFECLEILKSFQNLNHVFSNKRFIEPFKTMEFNVFIKIHAQHLKSKTQMVSKLEVLFDSNDVVFVLWVVVSQLF